MLVKALGATLAAIVVVVWSGTAIYREGSMASLCQLAGAIALVLVGLVHVAEATHVLPSMGWGQPTSPGSLLGPCQRNRERSAAHRHRLAHSRETRCAAPSLTTRRDPSRHFPGMMRSVRIGRLLAAILVTLCVGLQVLEATGRWDRTVQDSGDEAIIVTFALCIGAAVATARRLLARVRISPIATRLPLVPSILPRALTPLCPLLPLAASPPLPLRI